MAKQTRHIKGTTITNNEGKGSVFVHHESIDDSLLPDSQELTKLKELDPNIMDWIKERASKEQDARLEFDRRKISLLENNSKRSHYVDFFTISCAFLIILACMVFSYFLLEKGQSITSTIFAGITIILAANSFLNFRKKTNTTPSGKK